MRTYIRSAAPLVLLSLIMVIILPSMAHAQYLDPGAGSMLLQVIVALVVGLGAGVKLYWRRVSGFFGRSKRSDQG